MTREDLLKLVQKPGYAIASTTHKDFVPVKDRAEVKSAVVEPRPRAPVLDASKTEKGDPGRFHIVVTSYRRRLLDEDNLCEKYHIDCLRYAGIIPGDAPKTTHIEARQVQVSTEEDERTEIEIDLEKVEPL